MNKIHVLVFFFGLLLLTSCDDETSLIDSSVVGGSHFDLELYDESSIVAYNEKLNAVQSNNLPVNALGVLNHPNFGQSKVHYVTQVQLERQNPTFTNINSIVVDDVSLYIPYFSRRVSTAENGAGTFELDSIYGTSKIKLEVYENGYFLRQFDPNATTSFTQQRYYTDEFQAVDQVKIGTRLNNSTEVKQNDEFIFDKAEIVEETENGEDEEPTITRRVPGMLLSLDKTFFKNKLFTTTSTPQLVNNNLFTNHFRGLFFKVDEIAGESGSLNMMDFRRGVITVKYREEDIIDHDNNPDTPPQATMVEKTMQLNLTGNSISLWQQTFNPTYQTALESSNPALGDPNLWIKGGYGSMAIIKLFGRNDDDTDVGFTDELTALRQNDWLINEASLTFHIDRPTFVTGPEPVRIMLYDIKNRRPLLDYTVDGTTNNLKPKLGKVMHGGIIERDLNSGGRGVRYKIRITNHIRNIIRRDSTNVRLGLIVVEDIAQAAMGQAQFRNPSQRQVTAKPVASVMNPLGTILYGNHPSVPEDKRLKLNIYFTKPN
jgi:hypothetical protein